MLKKKKSQIIRFEQNLCNANVDDNEVLFVRVSSVVTEADARFEVPPTHTALVIKGGGDLRYYKNGTHPVFDDKKEVKNWKSGVSVDVVYIPKETRVLLKWGTQNRFSYRDEPSNKVITIGARGELDVSVSNPEQFFRKVVGVKKEFNLDEFKKRFNETISSEFANLFLKVVTSQHLTYDQFDTHKAELAVGMTESLNPLIDRDWGLSVSNFKIAAFDLKDDDKASIEEAAAEKQRQEKLKEYLAEIERLDDKQWEREKYLRQLELQDNAAYYEVLKVMSNHQMTGKKNVLKCPNCGLEYTEKDKFCNNCGTRLSKDPIICPDCGHSNNYQAKFCSNCGKKF